MKVVEEADDCIRLEGFLEEFDFQKVSILFWEGGITVRLAEEVSSWIVYEPDVSKKFVKRNFKALKEAFIKYHGQKVMSRINMLTDPRWWIRDLAKETIDEGK